jgi:S1-C subfamily serine protease
MSIAPKPKSVGLFPDNVIKAFSQGICLFVLFWPLDGPRAENLAPACDKTTVELFREVSPSVVFLSGVSIDPYRVQERVKWGIGSGVVIDAQGHVLTNAHVVQRLKEVFVALDEDTVLSAEVLGADPIVDLAVVKLVLAPANFVAARLGDSDRLQVGEDVIAIGNAMGLRKTVSEGIVSGLNRSLPVSPMYWLTPYIQTDAALSPGNSGGPLLNRCGEVIGINSAVLQEGENIGFAIPINIAKRVLPDLMEKGRVIRPWHGINGQWIDFAMAMLIRYPLTAGFLIETVEPGSPAEKMGLRGGTLPLKIGQKEILLGGDIITEVNGERLNSMDTLLQIADSLKVGDQVEVQYFRDGELHSLKVVLPERPLLPGDYPPTE